MKQPKYSLSNKQKIAHEIFEHLSYSYSSKHPSSHNSMLSVHPAVYPSFNPTIHSVIYHAIKPSVHLICRPSIQRISQLINCPTNEPTSNLSVHHPAKYPSKHHFNHFSINLRSFQISSHPSNFRFIYLSG